MLEGEFPEGTYARYLDKEAAAEIRALKSHIDQLQILRNIEGVLTLDLLNSNNPFHEISDICKLIRCSSITG